MPWAVVGRPVGAGVVGFLTSTAPLPTPTALCRLAQGWPRNEVDGILRWLTGYSQTQLEAQITAGVDFRRFFADAPAINPHRSLIKGLVCGVRVEEVEEPLMREIRYLDKLVDELAKGKAMEKILRQA